MSDKLSYSVFQMENAVSHVGHHAHKAAFGRHPLEGAQVSQREVRHHAQGLNFDGILSIFSIFLITVTNLDVVSTS